MSTFGDGTFKQKVYECIEAEKLDHRLTWKEVISSLVDIAAYILEWYDLGE